MSDEVGGVGELEVEGEGVVESVGEAAGVPEPVVVPDASDAPPVAPGERTAALLADVERLEAAAAHAGTVLPVDARVPALLASVRERLALGVDHTVVALIGGTGSGKSSLFNAISGLAFADVGVQRPTTSRPTACVWAHDASALLAWLGVDPERQIERESALDGESQADLRGLVLLDLPDYDSVEPEHRAVVDRLLPQADLLAFVVDPQKYADDALHSGYLRHLAGHEDSMVVLLNQVDTVPEHARGELITDVGRLLRADGLAEVRVLGVSARTGEGVPELRAVLGPVVSGRGVAERRAAAELDDAAAALARVVGPAEPALPTGRAVEALLEAAGVPGEVAAVAASAGARPGGRRAVAGPAVLGPLQADRAGLVREAWLAEVGGGLPEAWAHAVERSVATEDELVVAVDEALAVVQVPAPQRRGGARFFPWLAVPVAGGAGAAAVLLEQVGWWGGAGAALLLAVLVPWIAARRRSGRARAASQALLARARAAVAAAVEATLGEPTRRVVDAHREVREAAAARRRVRPAAAEPSAADDSSTAEPVERPSTD